MLQQNAAASEERRQEIVEHARQELNDIHNKRAQELEKKKQKNRFVYTEAFHQEKSCK